MRLIVSDIHEKDVKLRAILREFSHCAERTFLGDYFDSFDSTPAGTALWLKEAIDDPANEFLLGNHDLQYIFPEVPGLGCSGYKMSTARLIGRLFMRDDWAKFKLVTRHGGWLISHAGVHASFVPRVVETAQHALRSLGEGSMSPLVAAGRARGGLQEYGGVTWLDWMREFEPVAGVNQICGHTLQRNATAADGAMFRIGDDSVNWNLDTNLNHVATLEGDVLTVHDVSGLT